MNMIGLKFRMTSIDLKIIPFVWLVNYSVVGSGIIIKDYFYFETISLSVLIYFYTIQQYKMYQNDTYV